MRRSEGTTIMISDSAAIVLLAKYISQMALWTIAGDDVSG